MRRRRDNGGWTPKRIKALRKRHRWTRKRFARVLKTTEMSVYRWENGLAVPIEVARERLERLESLDLNGAEI